MSEVDYQNMVNIDATPEERRKLYIGDIWNNQIECLKCGDKPRSKNKHHFATCECGAVSVDGGSHYVKNVGNKDNWKSLVIPFNNIEE